MHIQFFISTPERVGILDSYYRIGKINTYCDKENVKKKYNTLKYNSYYVAIQIIIYNKI